MADSPNIPDDVDETADGIAFYNDGAVDDDDEPRAPRPVLELDSGAALPALLDTVDYEDDPGSNTIDLDAAGAVGKDLSALFRSFDAAQRPRAVPLPEPTVVTSPPLPAPTGPLYDLSSNTAEPAQSEADAAEILRLRGDLETERNNVRRGMADLVNYRRKAEHDRERAIRDTFERTIKLMLPIFDDFERSVAATAETRSYDQLSDGVQAILRNFSNLLDKHGIREVESLGMMFDPDFHEAVGVDETSELPEDTIVEELRRGYLIDSRLLRAALVRVARHGEPQPSDLPTLIDDPDAIAPRPDESESA